MPQPKTPSKNQNHVEMSPGKRSSHSRILKAPFCLLDIPRVGTHFDFHVIKKSHLLEIDTKKLQFYSHNRQSQLRVSFESARRVGFEDIDVVDQKFQTLQKLSLGKFSAQVN